VGGQLRHHPPAHEGERDLGVGGDEADVGQQGVCNSDADGGAVDGGDDRLADVVGQAERLVGAIAARLVPRAVERLAAALEIGAGAERTAAPVITTARTPSSPSAVSSACDRSRAS
jgi:hypothetical protein